MRILIDALAAIRGGGAADIRDLLLSLGRVDTSNEYLVLRSPWQRFWDFELPVNIRLLEIPLPKKHSVLRRILWEQFMMPILVKEYNVDVLFSPADITTLRPTTCATVLAIRNLNPYYSSNGLNRGWYYFVNRRIVLKSFTRMSARCADKIIFSSNYSRLVMSNQLGISFNKTNVIYQGLNPIFHQDFYQVPSWLRHIPRPFLLCVSNITAHKNYPFLIHVFAKLALQSNFRHHLVIAGTPVFQKHSDKIQQIAERTGLKSRLHLLGKIPYHELPALYQQAELFIFPSLLETFGYPLVEAMASGVPVVASQAASIPEICEEAALYFDPTNVNDAVEKILQVLNNRSLQEQLIKEGKLRASTFSWERTAEKTVSVFEAAANEYRSGRQLRD